MQLDILGLGEPLFEFNRARGTPHWHEGIGGDTSNAMVAASRSGARTGYFTALGKDIFGEAVRAMWQQEGVDATHVGSHDTAPTGVYFVTHDDSGHNFTYLRKNSAASLVAPANLPIAALQNTKILHVSGISQAISGSASDAVREAIAIVRLAGGRVSYDTNLRLKLWPIETARATIHAAMLLVDIALPGLDDARLLTQQESPDAIVDFYLKLGAKIVALTLGAAGCLIATPQKRETIPSIIVNAVDATGAGDTFDGAFLAELLRCGDAFQAGRFANVAAALSTCGYGAISAMPRREAVMAALACG